MNYILRPVALMFLLFVSVAPLQAELIADAQWKVQPGDNMASILKQILPAQPERHARLEQLARKLNPRAFDAQGQLITGSVLRLPGARMPKTATAVAKKPERSQAGKVLVTTGGLYSVDATGKRRSLKRGSQVASGDTLETGRQGRSHIRFTDGSIVALQPETRFVIENYKFSGQQDGGETSFYRLVKGGFRTISGLIGKLNKERYRVTTPVATIGIRGTHYSLSYCAQQCQAQSLEPGLYGGVIDGSVVASNDAGEHIFGNDQFFHIQGLDSQIQLLAEPPGVLFGSGGASLNISDGDALEILTGGLFGDEEFEHEFGEFLLEELGEEGLDLDSDNIDEILETIRDEIEAALLDDVLPGKAADDDRQFGLAFAGKVGEGLDELLFGSSQLTSADLRDIQIVDGEIDTDDNVLVRVDEDGNPILFLFSMPAMDDRQSGFVEFSIDDALQLTPEDVGSSDTYDVQWGRWVVDDVSATIAAGGNQIEPSLSSGLHFISAGNALEPEQFSVYAGLRSAQGGSVLTLIPGGGTNPTDLLGNVGELSSAALQLDLQNNALLGLDIQATFVDTDTQYNLTLQETGQNFVNVLDNDGLVNLAGSCNGCNSDGTAASLSGEASIGVLLGNQPSAASGNLPALGATTVYSATDGNASGVSGTILFVEP